MFSSKAVQGFGGAPGMPPNATWGTAVSLLGMWGTAAQ